MESTTLALRFPWGRLHATPWDRNVNEGAVEWPPSSWRVLRALYATWRHRAPDLDEATVTALLSRLAEPPTFRLPPGRIAHTRHYMPDRMHRTGEKGRSVDKVIDAFMVTERGARIEVSWPFTLDGLERDALTRLASELPYLGRAESICEARLLVAEAPNPGNATTVRPVSRAMPTAGHPTRVLCPRRPLDLAALTISTVTVRAGKRLTPPGAVYEHYEMIEPSSTAPRPAQRERTAPEAFRWAVDAKARPAVTAALVMGDALRSACLSRHEAPQSAPRLSGRGPDSTKATHQHRHAHYLSFASGADPRIDTMALWVPPDTRLDPDEVRAISQVTSLSGRRFQHAAEFRPVNLVLEAAGRAEDVIPELSGSSQTWVSRTPFVPPRHRKRNQALIDFLIQEVTAELRARGQPDPSAVEITDLRPHAVRFRRHRLKETLRDARPAYGLHLEFAEPLTGPLLLGGLSHFGLGVFVPQ